MAGLIGSDKWIEDLKEQQAPEQAHFVGSAKYVLSADYNTGTTSSYATPSLSLASSDLTGNVEQNTASAPSITIPNAKKGTYVLNVTGMIGEGATRKCYAVIYDGTSYHSEQAVLASASPSRVFTVEHGAMGDLDLDLQLKSPDGQHFIWSTVPLEISVTYLPPAII